MWIIIAGIVFIAAVIMTSVLRIFVIIQKNSRKKASQEAIAKEELALQGISAGIGERLYAAYPDSKWRWVCCPASFALNGGIARIEVVHPFGKEIFIDVCLSVKGYMALHVLDVVELVMPDIAIEDSAPVSFESPVSAPASVSYETFVSAAVPKTGSKPHNEETIASWYNIVLIDRLTALIDDLNAKGEVCLNIGQDGKAHAEANGSSAIVCDFGEMPDISLWEHVTDKLVTAGLFAEIQEENSIFISWA